MKKVFEKVLVSIVLAIMVICAVPFTGINFGSSFVSMVNAASKKINDYNVGDIVEFGCYPQSQVTNNATVAILNSKAHDWHSYGYMSGVGTDENDGSAQKSDYMKYCDVKYNGKRYRGVHFSTYRPEHTNYESTTSIYYAPQKDNGYIINTTYWFEYESLHWRVLDPSTGLVLCENIIDSQPYSDTFFVFDYCYKDSNHSIYANNYYESSIRKWLNNEFYNTAFTDKEKSQINDSILRENNSFEPNNINDSKPSTDAITLLTWSDMGNTSYGFSNSQADADVNRLAHSTDYAKCQGCWATEEFIGEGFSYWWLRSAGIESGGCACGVHFTGYVSSMYDVSYNYFGVRPALNFNLSSAISKYNEVGDVDNNTKGETKNKTNLTDSGTEKNNKTSEPAKSLSYIIIVVPVIAITIIVIVLIKRKKNFPKREN